MNFCTSVDIEGLHTMERAADNGKREVFKPPERHKFDHAKATETELRALKCAGKLCSLLSRDKTAEYFVKLIENPRLNYMEASDLKDPMSDEESSDSEIDLIHDDAKKIDLIDMTFDDPSPVEPAHADFKHAEGKEKPEPDELTRIQHEMANDAQREVGSLGPVCEQYGECCKDSDTPSAQVGISAFQKLGTKVFDDLLKAKSAGPWLLSAERKDWLVACIEEEGSLKKGAINNFKRQSDPDYKPPKMSPMNEAKHFIAQRSRGSLGQDKDPRDRRMYPYLLLKISDRYFMMFILLQA